MTLTDFSVTDVRPTFKCDANSLVELWTGSGADFGNPRAADHNVRKPGERCGRRRHLVIRRLQQLRRDAGEKPSCCTAYASPTAVTEHNVYINVVASEVVRVA